MPDMTDEEYAALDELWTETTPKANFSRLGTFARQKMLLECLDVVSSNYIHTRALALKKSPSEIIGELVREKIATG